MLLYCGQFWFNSTNYCLNKLRVSYNNSYRRLLRLPMRNSASEMFVQCNILSFGKLLRKSIMLFGNHTIIQCMVNSVAPLVSNVWKWWRCSAHLCHLNHFCHSSPVLSIHINRFCQPHHLCQLRAHQFCQQYQPLRPLCRYRRGHYFCQQGPTTFVNRNFMILPMCAMRSHTLK